MFKTTAAAFVGGEDSSKTTEGSTNDDRLNQSVEDITVSIAVPSEPKLDGWGLLNVNENKVTNVERYTLKEIDDYMDTLGQWSATSEGLVDKVKKAAAATRGVILQETTPRDAVMACKFLRHVSRRKPKYFLGAAL